MSTGYPTSPSPPPSSQHWQQSGYGRPPAAPFGTAPASPSFRAPPPFAQPPSTNSMPPSTSFGPPPTTAPPFGQPYYAQGQWGQIPSFATPPPSPGAYQPYGYPTSFGGQYAQNMSTQFPPGTDQETMKMFQRVDLDGSGHIDAFELQKALSGTQPFSIRTVRLMIHLYGSKGSERIGPAEFVALWKALKDWKGIFEKFDKDRSGTIDSNEMRESLLSLGYAISMPILQCLLQKYDRTGQAKAMDYDSFVECGLIVKGLTEKFKEKDVHLVGSATLSYDDFMLMVLPFIVA